MIGKRTGYDFKDHVLDVVDNEHVKIHHFHKPNTCHYSIKFINTCDVMAVTGDLGNWIFCREFWPSAEGMVSDGYWIQKLKISSTQKPLEFSADLTQKEIERQISEGLEEHSQEWLDYLERILFYVNDGEIYYLAYAGDNLPDGYEHDSIPYEEQTDEQLRFVFDAFDEICRRMKEGIGNEKSVAQAM